MEKVVCIWSVIQTFSLQTSIVITASHLQSVEGGREQGRNMSILISLVVPGSCLKSPERVKAGMYFKVNEMKFIKTTTTDPIPS